MLRSLLLIILLAPLRAAPVSLEEKAGTANLAESGYLFKTFRLTAANGLPNKGYLRASAQ